ncbi:MAG: hypothetical protein MJE77_25215, partial [Proteobacteria bacterium]|nr:hypothetical protein [Pseudomonadota bacterium]
MAITKIDRISGRPAARLGDRSTANSLPVGPFVLVLGLLFSIGCLDSETELCEDGKLLCPAGYDCIRIEGEWKCIEEAVCGDEEVTRIRGEVCDDGNSTDGDGCSADCRSNESCGNGIVDLAAGEICDDGNTQSGDECSSDCRSKAMAATSLRAGPKASDRARATRRAASGCARSGEYRVVFDRRASPLAVMDRRSGDAESFWTGSQSSSISCLAMTARKSMARSKWASSTVRNVSTSLRMP